MVVTQPLAGRCGVRITQRARDFYLFQNVQTGSGFHPISTRNSFPRIKRPELEADHSPATSDEVEENVTVPLLLLDALMAWTETSCVMTCEGYMSLPRFEALTSRLQVWRLQSRPILLAQLRALIRYRVVLCFCKGGVIFGSFADHIQIFTSIHNYSYTNATLFCSWRHVSAD